MQVHLYSYKYCNWEESWFLWELFLSSTEPHHPCKTRLTKKRKNSLLWWLVPYFFVFVESKIKIDADCGYNTWKQQQEFCQRNRFRGPAPGVQVCRRYALSLSITLGWFHHLSGQRVNGYCVRLKNSLKLQMTADLIQRIGRMTLFIRALSTPTPPSLLALNTQQRYIKYKERKS